ncbi:MAG TPA: mannose-1-phosphate guanylyltransferase [Candidatus Saccharimonadales bacterium]|nr:mannose-1-phosphate guanylyltransferase [Candidatus Saccharimonadales bacterium]
MTVIENLYHVLMAGGSGTRFWPVSRKSRAKQFLPLVGDRSMIRQTFERCAQIGPRDLVYVSAGAAHREAVSKELPEISPGRFIAEPVARNTAPAVGLSAMWLFLADPDAVAVFCPADHVFLDAEGYSRAIEAAAGAAASGDWLVTLGIRPTRPETGYGYIEAGEPSGMPDVHRVAGFTEKPDLETARRLVAGGRHYWNSGVFIWRVASILAAIGRHHRPLAEALTRFRKAVRRHVPEGAVASPLDLPGVEETLSEIFAAQEAISIDYAVMEKAPNVLVVPCDAGWSDVGSWDAIDEMASKDDRGNALQGDVVASSSSDCFVRGGGRLIALVGVSDLIVVETDDALLVCRKGESQKVREIVDRLRASGRDDRL